MSDKFAFLIPAVQNYEWGVKGEKSLVANVWKNSQEKTLNKGSKIIEDVPYAELWYGVHSNGMNMIKADNQLIKITDFIKDRKKFHSRGTDNIFPPYLLKLLSSQVPLSIQCHPDKETAVRLHREKPSIYTDANHKPEVTLALSETVEFLCGFREWNEISNAINNIKEISDLLNQDWINGNLPMIKNPKTGDIPKYLKLTFERLMRSEKENLGNCLTELSKNSDAYLMDETIPQHIKTSIKIFRKLLIDYPDDVGCLSPFLLNQIVASPGQCFYIGPNILHSYLHGQMIECMSCSDNVLRGGLTPKHKDVDLLLEILDYSSSLPPLVAPCLISSPDPSIPSNVYLYDPEIGDFRLYLLHVPIGSHTIEPIKFQGDSCSILTVLQGKANVSVQHNTDSVSSIGLIEKGHSILLPLDSSITLSHACQLMSTSSSPSIRLSDVLNEKQDDLDFYAIVAIGGKSTLY